MGIADLRREYSSTALCLEDLASDPIEQFKKWFQEAVDAKVVEPNAMTLATANKKGHPSARVVLLKGVDQRGFIFFTNYRSRKGRELQENRYAALVFFWPELERQVCITGRVSKLPQAESEAYFRTRPRGSRLAAWASQQSEIISSRLVLEQKLQALMKQYPGEDIPLPPFWGGYLLAPDSIELWQGRPNRLHDRYCYRQVADDRWVIECLSP